MAPTPSKSSREEAQRLLVEAHAHLRDGAFERAIELFTACLAHAPARAEAYRDRAIARLRLKQSAEALADFTEARRLDPADREAWLGVAMSLAMDSRVYDALTEFEALLSVHPTFARGHLQLGLLYFQLCVTAKGRQQMEQALACQPTGAERRLIETALKEQTQLDAKRYYRPDFEALHNRRGSEQAMAHTARSEA